MSRASSEGRAAVEAYIAAAPPDVRRRLRAVRAALRKAAPKAEERISYRMPALFQDGVVAYYAAFKAHIGLFPPVTGEALKKRAAKYAGPKGNLKFPFDEALPVALITAVARARLAANRAGRSAKPKAKANARAKVKAKKAAAA